jgi:hypothetical protein
LRDLLPVQQRVLGPHHTSTQSTERMLRGLTEPRRGQAAVTQRFQSGD